MLTKHCPCIVIVSLLLSRFGFGLVRSVKQQVLKGSQESNKAGGVVGRRTDDSGTVCALEV